MKNDQNDIIRVYSGTEIKIEMIRAELAKIGIPSMVKNEFKSGLMAGFGASPSAVDLFVNSSDTDAAFALVQDLNHDR